MLKIKNITIGIILILSVFCYINHSSIASEGNVKLTYEQLTEQYPGMEQYITETRKNIKGNWYPPVKSFENKATIILTIDKEGKLLNCYMSEPSPDEGFNNSLIKAAKKTKYLPLPNEVKENSLDIDLSFNMQRRHIK